MAIYRGAGGAGDATGDSASEALLVRDLAVQVTADAAAAEAAKVAAIAAKVAAETAETNAETAETNAETAETNAETAQAAAASSASAASTSATNAAASATNASNSLSSVVAYTATATIKADEAATSATNAASSASSASTSATNAASSASAASTSATSASNSLSSVVAYTATATTQATNSANSATAASGSATSAASSASTATTQAGLASTSASNAAASESNAASSASAAATSASNAATSATNASNSASAASTSASNASTSEIAAAASAAAAAASYDSFDDRYLGAKSAAPTLDNDGNALVTGALYYNNGTVTPADKGMYVYDGSQWIAASAASTAILTVYKYTATASQTTFSGNDDNAVSLVYTAGSVIITLNGVVLEIPSEVTASSGTSVVLSTGAVAGDELNIYAFATFNVANTYTQAQVDATFLTKSNPSYTGTLTGGTGVVNIGSGQVYKDASGNVGIGTSSPTTWNSAGFAVRKNSSAFVGDSGSSVKLELYNNGNTSSQITFGQGFDSGSDGVGFIYNRANAAFVFGTNNTERMRIDSSGNLLVGTTSPLGRLTVSTTAASTVTSSFANTSADPYGVLVDFSSDPNNGTNYGFKFRLTNNTNIYTIFSNGTTSARSDERFKKNIETTRDGYAEDLSKLRVVKYHWHNIDDTAPKELGFIAQEVEQVFPNLISTEINDDGINVKSIKTSVFIPMLVKAIQEQQAIITDLKARIETLENK